MKVIFLNSDSVEDIKVPEQPRPPRKIECVKIQINLHPWADPFTTDLQNTLLLAMDKEVARDSFAAIGIKI